MKTAHHPSKNIAYLEGDRALATNESRDRYFIVEPDGSFERIDPAKATALYQQRLRAEEACRVMCLHAAREFPKVIMRQLAAIQQRELQEKESKRRERRRGAGSSRSAPGSGGKSDVRTKRIRIADKKRELEARIRELEAKLAESDDADSGE
jgi:hypothetical protein